MILHEADISRLEERVGIILACRPYSSIDDNGTVEESLVKLWLMGIDATFRAQAGQTAPPVWIVRRFKWGPHPWPVCWDQLPRMRNADCGAIAALSTAVMQWRGMIAFPVQLVLRFVPECTRGWSALWSNAGVAMQWCGDTHAYH